MIDHLSITTTDLDRAQAFYDATLGALGYPRVHRRAEAMGYGVRDHGSDAAPYISIYLCTGKLVPTAAPTTDRQASERDTVSITTPLSCAIPTATGSKPSRADPRNDHELSQRQRSRRP